MTAEEIEAQRIAQEQSVQPTTELLPPVDGGQEQAVGEDGQPKEKVLLAGKYETPQALEQAYQDLLTQNTKTEGENLRYRDHYLREQESAAQAQATESTSGAEEQKTGRQNAEKLLSQGRYLDAQEKVTETAMAKALKPITERQEAQAKEAKMQAAAAAFDSLNGDQKNFPEFGKLEAEMDALYNERKALNPHYENSFKSSKAMMASLYFEVRSQHPEVGSKGRALAGAVSAGSGAGARTPGLPQARQSQAAKARWLTDDRWDKLGMKRNPYQFEESPEDVTNRELAEQGDRINELLTQESPAQ